MNYDLKELRRKSKLTQQEVADSLGISLRSYITYENDKSKRDSIKYKYMVEKLAESSIVDEEHGILDLQEIKEIVNEVFKEYDIYYCYLFGSYAKNNANEKSDVDLLVSTNTSGLAFYGLVERLREGLKKRVDLLNINQLENNRELLNEILKDGIKIYG